MAIGTLEVLLVNAKGLGDNDFLGFFSFSFSLFFAGIPSFLIQKTLQHSGMTIIFLA
jgi:hypothetical protein